MQFDFSKLDYSNERPKLVLKKIDGSVIGVLSELFDMQLTPSYNEVSELSFTVPAFSHGLPTPFYKQLAGMRIVELPDIGQFILTNPKTIGDGIREVKECSAYSLEYELSYKTLNLASGTYNLWNPANPEGTIIGMFMEDNPLWARSVAEIRIDADLIGRYRTFEVSDNWYNFLKNTAQEAYQCVFDFDTFTRTITARSVKEVCSPSEVFISLDNLAKEIEIEENTDDMFTCLDVNGADGVDIRSVNPTGTNKIYNLDHFMTLEHFSQDIIDRWYSWKNAVSEAQVPFYTLTIQAAVLTAQIESLKAEYTDLEGDYKSKENLYAVAIQAERQNITPSTSSAEYKKQMDEIKEQMSAKQAEIDAAKADHASIQESLKAKSNALDIKKAFTDENGSTEPWTLISGYIKESVLSESSFVVSEYDLYSTLSHMDNLKNAKISIIDSVVTEVETETDERRMFSLRGGSIFIPGADNANIIMATCDVRSDNTIVLSAYLEGVTIDGRYFPNSNLTITCSISSFTATDSGMTFENMNGTLYLTNVATEFQQQAVKWELYEYGMEVLEKAAHPNYTFNVDCSNFLADEDFLRFKNKLKLGQRIYLRVDDNTVLKPIVIGAEINLYDPTEFSITFANKYNEKTGEQALQDWLQTSISLGSTIDTDRFTYNAYKDTHANNAVEKLINEALDVSKNAVLSGNNQAFIIDDSGIKLRKRKEGTTPDQNLYEGSQIWMVNNNMIFLDENGNARLAIGEVGGNFGIVADYVYGNIFAGENVVISNNKSDGTEGTFIIDGSGITVENNAFKILFTDKGGSTQEMSVEEYVTKNSSSAYRQDTPPEDAHEGTLWFNTGERTDSHPYDKDKWYRHNGTGWDELTDGELSAIIKTENGVTTVKLDTVRGAIDTTVAGMASTIGNLVIDETGMWLIDTASPTTASKAVWMNGSGIVVSNSRTEHDSNDPSYNDGTNSSFDWTTAISAEGVFASKFIGDEIFGNIALGIGTPATAGDITSCPFYVDKNGNLHAKGADINGSIDCSKLYINGKDALKKIGNDYKISNDYLDVTSLTAATIEGGTVEGASISGGSITGSDFYIEYTGFLNSSGSLGSILGKIHVRKKGSTSDDGIIGPVIAASGVAGVGIETNGGTPIVLNSDGNMSLDTTKGIYIGENASTVKIKGKTIEEWVNGAVSGGVTAVYA